MFGNIKFDLFLRNMKPTRKQLHDLYKTLPPLFDQQEWEDSLVCIYVWYIDEKFYEDRIYIGSTIGGASKRWKEHIKAIENQKHNNLVKQYFQELEDAGINEHPEEIIYFDVIEYLPDDWTKEQAQDREQEYFNLYLYKGWWEYVFNVDTEARTDGTTKKIPVYQFNLKGELIGQYESTNQAERMTGCSHRSILYNCNTGIHTETELKDNPTLKTVGSKATGERYIWSYTPQLPKPLSFYLSNDADNQRTTIIATHMETGEEREFVSQSEATRTLKSELGKSRQGAISLACRGESKSAYGYTWRLKYPEKAKAKRSRLNPKAYSRYDIETHEYIDTFSSASAAAKYLKENEGWEKATNRSISRCSNKNKKVGKLHYSIYGYLWLEEKDSKRLENPIERTDHIKLVYEYDLEGGLVAEFTSTKEVGESYGLKYGTVKARIRNKVIDKTRNTYFSYDPPKGA